MKKFNKAIVAVLTVATLSSVSVTNAQAAKWWKKPLVQGIGVGVGIGIVSAVTRPRGNTVYVERNCWEEKVTYRNSYGEYYTKFETVCR